MVDHPREAATWNDLPRWVQKQRNWFRKNKATLGEPAGDPVWGEDSLSQSFKKLHDVTMQLAQKIGPLPRKWFEFDGDAVAEEILWAWIEHLRCAECDMPEPADFGDDWGTVICANMECETEWTPDWFTPWAPPSRKPVNPTKYVHGGCVMCGKINRRLTPNNIYDFVCKPPKNPTPLPTMDILARLMEPASVEREREESQATWETALEASCTNRYYIGHQEGWYRFMPVFFPFCKSCGVLFASRLEDQEFCSRECGPMPANNARRLRKLASQASPSIKRSDVFERDKWQCHICSKPISRHPETPLQAASLDHVIPIVRGGTHTMSNVKASHLLCNIQKSASMPNEDELASLRHHMMRRNK